MDDTFPLPARLITPNLLSRRAFIVGAGFCLASACATVSTPDDPTADSRLTDIESKLGGRVGVLAIDTANGARLSSRPTERFALCSTSKLLVAAAVLAKVDRGQIALDQQIRYGPQDLLKYSPVSKAHVAQGSLPVEILLQAAMEESDNTAADLLFCLIAGPAGLTQFLRQQGDAITRLDRNEPSLSSNLPGDPRDTTTPTAMLATMNKILLGQMLTPDSRQKLTDWMKNCHTGMDRLRAGLPKDWITADKTGTGDNGAANDVAILWPPNRPPILIAAFLSDSAATPSTLEAAHAKIGAIVAAAFATK